MIKILAFLAVLAVPAHATPLTTGGCNDLWAFAERAFDGRMTSSAVMLGGQGCAVRDVVISGSGKDDSSARIKSVSFRGVNLATGADWLTGDGLTLAVQDLRMIDGLGDPPGLDADLNLKRSGEDWQIERLSAAFPGGDQMSLSATLAGLDLTSRDAALQTAPSARVTALDLTLSLQGAANGIMPALLAQSKAPPAVDDLPDTSLNANSKAALNAMLAEGSTADGTLHLTLTAPDGIAVSGLMALALVNRDDPAALLTAVLAAGQFDVVWTDGH